MSAFSIRVTNEVIEAIPRRASEPGTEALIARSKPQERADGSGLWWKEYRVRALAAGYPCAWVLEVCYRGPGSAKIENVGQWQFWEGNRTAEACIWEMMGDTHFAQAERLDNRFAAAAELYARLQEASRAHRAAVAVLEQYRVQLQAHKDHANGEYRKALARIEETDPKREAKETAVTARMVKKYGPELDRLRDEIAVAETAVRLTGLACDKVREQVAGYTAV